MLYEKLLNQVINTHFPENKFNLKGKLEWYPVTERMKTRYLKKTGKELKNQRRKYKITDVFWKKSTNDEKTSNPYYFNHILISEIEQNEIFYCISDFCIGRLMGHRIRYKFRLLNTINLELTKHSKIELINDSMIMIR